MAEDIEQPNRDERRLHPELVAAWHKFANVMAEVGHPVFLVEGYRSFERQDWLYAQGRTRDGKIVTNAKAGQSDHNPDPDGLSHALDFAFRGREPFAEWHPWGFAGQVAAQLGLEWGGTWRKPDKPHLALKEIE